MLRSLRATAVLILIGLAVVLLSSPLWPADRTAQITGVAELQSVAWFGIPVLAVGLVLLLFQRRWFLASIVILVASAVALIGLPRIPASFPPSSSSQSDATPVRVFSVNTFFGGANRQALADTVTRIDPQVIVLVETNPKEAAYLAADTNGAVLVQPDPGKSKAGGASIIVRGDGVLKIENPNHPVAEFQLPTATGHNVRFAGVHPVAPIGEVRKQWDDDLQAIGKQAAEWAHQEETLVMMGDFNSAREHPRFRELVAQAGLHDCTSGVMVPAPTWPSSLPVVRLDHVLTTGECGDAGTAKVSGSDHLAVWADVFPQRETKTHRPKMAD